MLIGNIEPVESPEQLIAALIWSSRFDRGSAVFRQDVEGVRCKFVAQYPFGVLLNLIPIIDYWELYSLPVATALLDHCAGDAIQSTSHTVDGITHG